MGIADELITRGWTQGLLESKSGAVCLMGAARRYAGWPNKDAAAYRYVAAADAIAAVIGGNLNIADFNDDPGRTFDEVLRVAKEADEILDAQ